MAAMPPTTIAKGKGPAGQRDLEATTHEYGNKLFALMDAAEPPSLFSKKGFYGTLMEWAMRDEHFKTQLFRFVDVLPTLRSSGEVARHLTEYLGDDQLKLSPALRLGLKAAGGASWLFGSGVKAQVTGMARRLGFPFEFWDRQRTKDAVGSNRYLGALFDPNSGQVHPMKLTHGWKAAAEGVGARVFENTPVVSIEEGSTHRLRTTGGREIKAKSLVLATNAYTSKAGHFRNTVVPLHAYIGITPPLEEGTLNEIGWRSRLPFFDSRTLVYYLGLTRDNRIHIGGGRVDYSFNSGLAERGDGESAYAALKRELVRIFPRLAGMNFETTWSGLVDMTPDFAPAVGRTGKHGNVYYGLGYCGHGVNLTSLFGRIIADLELGLDSRWDTLPFVNRTPLYVPNEPFRWLGVQGALEYYRRADHIE